MCSVRNMWPIDATIKNMAILSFSSIYDRSRNAGRLFGFSFQFSDDNAVANIFNLHGEKKQSSKFGTGMCRLYGRDIL